MMRTENKSTRKIEDQAMHWLVQMGDGDVPEAERALFEAWLASDPAHRAAYDAVREVWEGASELQELKSLEPRHLPDRQAKWFLVGARPWSQKIAGAALASMAAVVLLVFGLTLMEPAPPELAVYATEIAEIRDITLEDGSEITLGARSEISIEFTDRERRVVLLSGEAFFSVTRNPKRLFVVEARDTLVQVVGTQFNVRTGFDLVTVSVLEGEVHVAKIDEVNSVPPGGLLIGAQRLTAGQQLASRPAEPLEAVIEVSTDEAGAWRSGHLYYDNVSLREVIADARRYSNNKIIISSPEVGDLKLTASFKTSQIDRMIRALDQGLPVEVDETVPGQITLRARNRQ